MDFANAAAFQAVAPVPAIPHPVTLGHTGTVPFITNSPYINFPIAGVSSRKRTLRGSDDMMASTPNGTSTNVIANQDAASPNANDHDAKKVKRENKSSPSRVVHLRNLANEALDAEVISLAVPFGRVTKFLMLKGKNQAFLEMADEASAQSLINHYTNVPSQIRGRAVYCQFSNHKELKTDYVHTQQQISAQVALQAAQQQAMLPHMIHTHTTKVPDTGGGVNTVLRVIVENVTYQITVDTLHEIFSKFGTILRIVTFIKSGQFQALIQFADATCATRAKLELDGKNIYNNCCHLHIDFSKLTNLSVKYNNEKSRDYTCDLPAGDALTSVDPSTAAMFGLGGAASLISPYATAGPTPFAAAPTTPAVSLAAAGYHGATAAMPGFHTGLSALPPQATAHGIRLPPNMYLQPGSPVLLVSNLTPELVTPQALFTLFGVYGDVQRVKILYEKRDNALIQMSDPHQAQTAMKHLTGIKLYGKQIRVTASKHNNVQLPKEGQPDVGLTKDFSTSPLHRFKKPGSKNFLNIYAPSSTLHLSNIPPTITEENLKGAFGDHGTVVNFKFFPKDRKMALIQMNSVEEATHALIAMHNYQLGESNHLRVSFSKAQI